MRTITLGSSNESAVVAFVDSQQSPTLYLPRLGSPRNVADVLLAISTKFTKGALDAGQAVADFIAAVQPAVRCRLLSSYGGATDWKYRYQLYVRPYCGHAVNVARAGETKPLFDDVLFKFTTWAKEFNDLGSLVHKIVQFEYEGGSEPGKTRTIRVEKADVTCIEGYDLEKPDLLNDAYRRYSVEKIKGGTINVLN